MWPGIVIWVGGLALVSFFLAWVGLFCAFLLAMAYSSQNLLQLRSLGLTLLLGGMALSGLVGCGPAFRLQDAAGNDLVNVESVQLPTSMLKTVDGQVSWKPSDSDALQLEFEMKIPFKRVFKMSSQLVKELLPFSCQFIPGISNSSVSSYQNGEIPCGGLIDNDWKQLLVVNVDPMTGNSDGFDYQVGAVQIPVWLSRQQHSGTYAESDLDSKTNLSRSSSRKFGEDVSLRYSPKGSSAEIELCLNVPGTTIRSTRQNVYAKASKRVLGIKLSYDSDFDIDPGQASFDYARGCFAMDFGWTVGQSAPTVSLKTTQNPALNSVQYSGLNIKIKDWFLRLVDNVMGFFKSSIRKKVQEQVVGKVNDMLDQDVESGRWFTKIHGEELVKDTGVKLTKQISKAVNRIGLPSSVEDLRTQIKDSCRLKKLSLSQDWTAKLEEFCQKVVSEIQISIEPFAVDSASNSQGCYSHLARLHDSNGKWWASECQFMSKFKVTLPNPFEDFQNELKLMVASQISMDRIPEDWQDAIDRLKLDEATLAQVLEELERLGYNQVLRGDFDERIATLLAQIRSQAARLD